MVFICVLRFEVLQKIHMLMYPVVLFLFLFQSEKLVSIPFNAHSFLRTSQC